MTPRGRLPWLLVAALLAGCPDDDAPASGDAGRLDAAPPDAARRDGR